MMEKIDIMLKKVRFFFNKNLVYKNVSGKLGIMMPNEDVIEAISLDKTRKHAFNPSSLKNAVETVEFKALENEITIKSGGFYMLSEK